MQEYFRKLILIQFHALIMSTLYCLNSKQLTHFNSWIYDLNWIHTLIALSYPYITNRFNNNNNNTAVMAKWLAGQTAV